MEHSDEEKQLEARRTPDPFVGEVLLEVRRILASRSFSRVQQRTADLLRFIVTEALLGRQDRIKETTIATSVYGEEVGLDSTKIRVAMAALRRRLGDYYKTEGRNDPLEICIAIGHYVPQIRDHRPSLALEVVENWNPTGDQGHLCSSFTDEVAYQLHRGGVLVGRRVPEGKTERASRFKLRGSLECSREHLRINISVADAQEGVVAYADCFEDHRDDLFRLSRRVSDQIVKALHRKAA